jgi:hypothetical protein
VVEEGLASVAKTGAQLFSPHLHNVKGELLLVQNPRQAGEAERCFRTAIEVARRQSARWPELGATMFSGLVESIIRRSGKTPTADVEEANQRIRALQTVAVRLRFGLGWL